MQNESILRLFVFITLFILFSLIEIYRNKRKLIKSKRTRWVNNLSLGVVNSLMLKLVFPFAAFEFAIWCNEYQIGMLNHVNISLLPSIIISLFLLDGVIWWQHRLFHKVSFLWQFHAVHHSDQDIDVSTAMRFHFVEILISMLIKFIAIAFLGIAPLSVILFELLLNAFAMFNHSNIRLPTKLNQILSRFVVTPDLHRIHHSVMSNENDSNFGFALIFWDKWFGSFKSQPSFSHETMELGLTYLNNNQKTMQLFGLLCLPFHRKDKSNSHERY